MGCVSLKSITCYLTDFWINTDAILRTFSNIRHPLLAINSLHRDYPLMLAFVEQFWAQFSLHIHYTQTIPFSLPWRNLAFPSLSNTSHISSSLCANYPFFPPFSPVILTLLPSRYLSLRWSYSVCLLDLGQVASAEQCLRRACLAENWPGVLLRTWLCGEYWHAQV
jgi:hypothetical protein